MADNDTSRVLAVEPVGPPIGTKSFEGDTSSPSGVAGQGSAIDEGSNEEVAWGLSCNSENGDWRILIGIFFS